MQPTPELQPLLERLLRGAILPNLRPATAGGCIHDPLLDVDRHRVAAESLQALLRVLPNEAPHARDLVVWLLSRQKPDGSWNEVHPQYDQPSALITSFVGLALLAARSHLDDPPPLDAPLARAAAFVLANERAPGCFLKSTCYPADTLNVNASCGAFLAEFSSAFRNATTAEAAARAAAHVAEGQFPNGSFPYSTREIIAPHPYHHHIPDIHYQGVTLYYLARIHHALPDTPLEPALRRGAAWLAGLQRPDGRFRWDNAGLLFALYLTGAYAFAAAAWLYAARWDPALTDAAGRAVAVLERSIRAGALPRWEPAPLLTLPAAVPRLLRIAAIGDYPFSHRLYRFAYGLYKDAARRRFSASYRTGLCRLLLRVLRIRSSTFEPSANYPDLFLTSEALDCLSWAEDTQPGHPQGASDAH